MTAHPHTSLCVALLAATVLSAAASNPSAL